MTLLCTLKFLLKDSYAYYGGSNELPILSTKIGNFSSGNENLSPKASHADINILLYLQDGVGSNKYNQVDYMPVYGYTLNKEKSVCTPKSTNFSKFDIDSDKVIVEMQENKPDQVNCRVYYDLNDDSDLIIYTLVENKNFGSEELDGKYYQFVEEIPDTTYQYYKYKCRDGDIVDLAYDEQTRIFSYESSKPSVCYAYFNKKVEE